MYKRQDIKGKTVSVLGLTFKPNTDDMRDSPSLDIIPMLQEAGATIKAYDPAGMDECKELFKDVKFCEGPYETFDGADIVVLITEWDEFRALDLKRMKELMNAPIMVDLRNVYRPSVMVENGFQYTSIGR